MKNKYITSEQFNQFKDEGFVKISNCLTAELLNKLRLFIDEVVGDENDSHKVTVQVDDKSYVTNLELLCYKKNLACLELLGSPFLLDIAQAICGEDFFCLQEFAVIKNLGDNLPVLWHQDMIHQRTGNCFMVGVYLDDANVNDGALKVIPKSHLSNKNICDVIKEEYVEIPMQAGDILIHDMMLEITRTWVNPNGNGSANEALVPENLIGELEPLYKASAAKILNSGLVIKPVRGMEKGFQLLNNHEGYKVSFTEDDFQTFFESLIKPKVKELLFNS